MRKLTSLNFWKRFIPKLKAFTLTIALTVMVILQGWGETITSTATGGNFNQGSTWSGGNVPATTDDIIIDGPVSIEAGNSETCHNLTINDGKKLYINKTNTKTKLTVNGTLTIVGTGTIDANYIALVYGTAKALVYSGTKAKIAGKEWPLQSWQRPENVSINNSGGITIGESRTLSSLTINPAGAATINVGVTVTINNEFLIESSSEGTGSLILKGSLGGSGTQSVQRYIPSPGWHIVSSPVSGQQLGSFVTGNSIVQDANAGDYDLAPYNTPGDAWTPYTIAGNTSTFGAGQGYVVRRSTEGTVTFSGKINSRSILIPSFSTAGFGWNALGNPYTSAINAKGSLGILKALIEKNILPSTNEALYIWDESGDDYFTISNVNTASFPNDPTGILSSLDQAYIAVGQGFIIKAAATGSVYFTHIMQVSQPTTSFKSSEVPSPAIRLTVSAGDMRNQTIVAFGKDMTNGLDPSFDAGKLKGNPDLALYTKLVDGSSNVDFAVQALPDVSFNEVRIPVGLDFPAGGEVVFSLELSAGFRADAEVYLEDTQALTLTQLNAEDAKYAAILAAGAEGSGRFNLLVTKYTVTGINNPVAENSFKVFNLNNTIYINGPANTETSFALYSIDGKMWTSRRAENLSQNMIDASAIPAGVYLLNIKHKGISQTEKLVLEN